MIYDVFLSYDQNAEDMMPISLRASLINVRLGLISYHREDLNWSRSRSYLERILMGSYKLTSDYGESVPKAPHSQLPLLL